MILLLVLGIVFFFLGTAFSVGFFVAGLGTAHDHAYDLRYRPSGKIKLYTPQTRLEKYNLPYNCGYKLGLFLNEPLKGEQQK